MKELLINMATIKDYPYIAQGPQARKMFNIMSACIKASVPFGLVSGPGVGKTATIEAIAKAEGRELINLSLSTMPPEDVAGLPFPTQIEVGQGDNRHTVHAAMYAMPAWQQRLLNNPHSILFLDEFSTAQPTTQHAFLQLVQNRRLPGSDEPFSDDVAIVIAMNPADQAGGSALDLPIANRFSWFVFDQSFDDWADGFKTNWVSHKEMPKPWDTEKVDEDEIRRRNLDIRALIIKYLNSSKGSRQVNIVPTGTEQPTSSQVRKNNAADMEVFRMAFPSARTWDNLANIMTYLDPKDTAAIQDVINGTIGSAQGVIFYQYYLENIKGIDIDRILNDPTSQNWKDMTLDDSAGIFQGLMQACKDGKAEQVLDVYLAIKDAGALDLLSGNRIQDLFKAEYQKGWPVARKKEFTKKYIDAFGDFLKRIAKD